MNTVLGFSMKGIAYFVDSVRFDFKPGLTYVRGRNLHRTGADASNGAGKSLLFGALPNALLDTHPVITKNTRSVSKRSFGADGEISVDLKHKNATWTYVKSNKPARLLKDGVDQKSRIADKQMRALMGSISEEEFFATAYIDSRRASAFQLGTSAERYAFITNLFRLDVDDLRRHLARCVSELESDGRVLDQTKADLQSVKQELSQIPKDSAKLAKETYDWLNKAVERKQAMLLLKDQQERWAKYESARRRLKQLTKPTKTARELRLLLEAHASFKSMMEAYTERQSSLDSARRELEKLSAVDVSVYDKMVSRRARLQDGVQKEPVQPTEDVKSARQLVERRGLSKEQVGRAVSKADATLRSLQDQLRDFDNEVGDADACPTCHSVLSSKVKQAVRSRFDELIDTQRRRLALGNKLLRAFDVIESWRDYELEHEAWLKHKKLRKLVEGYDFAGARRKTVLTAELSKAKNSKRPTKPEGEQKQLRVDLDAAVEYDKALSNMEALAVDKPTGEFNPKALEKLSAEIEERMRVLPKLQSDAAIRKSKRRQLLELTERAAELEANLADLPVYKMLVKAYSVKGVKTLMVQRIAKSIELNLNKHSRQIFSEDFKFNLEVADGKFDILVTRTVRGKRVTSDVRHLSGAESRLFIYQSLLALLPLIPSSRRLNFIILDEPDSNMDMPTLETFSERLLPALCKIVPSVVVITPRHDYMSPNARIVTVVKEGGRSRLVDGSYQDVPVRKK